MTLTEKVIRIQQDPTIAKEQGNKWEHHEKIIEILKIEGVYPVPAPKSYITEAYKPPTNFNTKSFGFSKTQPLACLKNI